MSREFNKKQSHGNFELPAPVKQLAENTVNVLLNQLTHLFTSCDDLFFDLSSRASSNSEQNLYFESMREVRLKKGGIIAGFKREIDRQYDELGSSYSGASDPRSHELTASSLTLIENDQLEQKVAISGMVSKARAKCQEELYHLNCRFDYLINHKQINEKNNPLDPEQICLAFSKASGILELDIKARIILLKQFDRFVIAKLPNVYAQANQMLINAGVLPKIQLRSEKNGSTTGNQTGSSNSSAQSDDQTTENLASDSHVGLIELRNLLDGLRTVGIATPSVVALIPSYNGSAPVLPRNELLNLLSDIQSQATLSQQSNKEVGSQDFDIRNAIKHIMLSTQEQGAPKSIQQLDEDIINLVAMFFDFVLDDRNIPVQVQALISRLQIPVLKIALKNKSFFNSNQHPARCLINEIASAGIGFSETNRHQQDKLFEKIVGITQTIHDNHVNNEDIFAEQLCTFREYLRKEDRKANLIEKRASEAAIGNARTQHARSVIQALLDERLQNKRLPKAVVAFLLNQWKQVLFIIHLKEGDQSAGWLEAVQLVDDLIWCSRPHEDDKSKSRLHHLLPTLYKQIEQLLQLANTSSHDNQNTLSQLKKVHSLIASNAIDQVTYRQPSESTQPVDTTEGEKSWREMTAVERQQANYRKLEYSHIKTAEKMPIGTWLEFTTPSDGVIRCKLMAKIDVSDSYIFVNRFGSKVLEKGRKQFAHELQHRQAKILDRGALFDRATGSIAQRLNDLRKSANSAI